MLIEIPLNSGYPFFSFQTVLEEQEYTFKFLWNDRANHWYLSILDIDDNILVGGICVVSNWNLLFGRYVTGLPKGALMAINMVNDVDATLNTLGVDVKLIYEESDG